MVEHLWFCVVLMVEHKQFKYMYLGKLGKLGKLANPVKKNFEKLKMVCLLWSRNIWSQSVEEEIMAVFQQYSAYGNYNHWIFRLDNECAKCFKTCKISYKSTTIQERKRFNYAFPPNLTSLCRTVHYTSIRLRATEDGKCTELFLSKQLLDQLSPVGQLSDNMSS